MYTFGLDGKIREDNNCYHIIYFISSCMWRLCVCVLMWYTLLAVRFIAYLYLMWYTSFCIILTLQWRIECNCISSHSPSFLPPIPVPPSLPPCYPLFLPPTLFFFLLSLPNAQSCCFNLLLPTSLFYSLPCPPTSPLQRSHQLKFHFIMKKTNDSPFIILFYIANRFIIYMFVFTCTFTYTVVAEERDLTKYFR